MCNGPLLKQVFGYCLDILLIFQRNQADLTIGNNLLSCTSSRIHKNYFANLLAENIDERSSTRPKVRFDLPTEEDQRECK
jgi:hypothetical protein